MNHPLELDELLVFVESQRCFYFSVTKCQVRPMCEHIFNPQSGCQVDMPSNEKNH